MTQSVVSVGAFLLLLACLPLIIKWIKRRTLSENGQGKGETRFVSALAVGPHQRVVTVEVGPEGRRLWLVLGVTSQEITCLHRMNVDLVEGGAAVQVPPGLITESLA
jgi:flagellar protein FliO/FliZ